MKVVKIMKARYTKKCVLKRKLEFVNYKNCLEEAQLEYEINYLNNKINIDRVKENQKEFVKNNKSILRTKQRFKNKRHNILMF